MDDLRARIDQLAELMDDFRLSQAELSGEDWRVAFRRRPLTPAVGLALAPGSMEPAVEEADEESVDLVAMPAVPQGMPVSSPMTGIFYTSPSPSAPPFVREGEPVNAGQVVGLIEAMKVFNEITAPMSGTVTKVAASSGQLVQPGDALLYIG